MAEYDNRTAPSGPRLALSSAGRVGYLTRLGKRRGEWEGGEGAEGKAKKEGMTVVVFWKSVTRARTQPRNGSGGGGGFKFLLSPAGAERLFLYGWPLPAPGGWAALEPPARKIICTVIRAGSIKEDALQETNSE